MDFNKYKITNFESEELKPEETLADALSIHRTIETPISRSVFNIFHMAVVLIFVFFIIKACQFQIINGEHFASSAEQNSLLSFQLSSLRGLIFDSHGQVLVENIPVFDLVAVHAFLPKSGDKLAEDISRISPILNENAELLKRIFEDNQDQASFVIKSNLSKEEVVKIKTVSLSYLFVVTNARRHYIDGPASAHLLGNTAKVTPEDLNNESYLFINDRIGRTGLEAEYEQFLRGEHRNFNFLSKEETLNQENSEITEQRGSSLFLNIDSSVQRQLYKSMISVFASAGVRRGAAVVQNPKTGAVLGLVSMPTFNNNIFEDSSSSESISAIPNILKNTDRPLLNRAISGRYSPGSTIKPLLALAGLKEGVVTPSTIVFANGGISVQSEVDPGVFYTFRDWKVHGWTDIKKAIADSVDVYFYSLGGGYGNIKGLGIDKISNYIKGLGADKITGIDLPGEISGFVPSKEWKKETKGESWYVGDTYNISIGQGDLLVTPIWLDTYVSAIANGGSLMKPQIVNEIRSADGQLLQKNEPRVLSRMPFDKGTIDIVRQGMRETVLSGTATLLQDVPVALAAKTGTAQISGRGLNSLFTIFGPYDDPEIVMTVLVENINQSQGLAIRVANDFLLWYFTKRNEAQ